MRRLSLLLPLVLCAGCFVLADTDDFVDDESCDLELDVRAFSPHIGQTFEVRLTQGPPADVESRPRLLALAIFDPLQSPNVNLDFPNAVPALADPTRPRPFLDFYADFNGDGGYTSPPSDHTWRIEDPCDPDRDPEFVHNTDFLDLPMPIGGGSDLLVDFCSNLVEGGALGPLAPFDGTEPIEVRVTGTFPPPVEGLAEESRAVGFYRLETAASSPTGVRLPAVLDSGFRYKIEIIVDRNDDFAYQSEADQAWTYLFNPDTAPDCPSLDDMRTCGLRAEEVTACLDGPNIRVRLSRGHVPNFSTPTEVSWVQVPEGT